MKRHIQPFYSFLLFLCVILQAGSAPQNQRKPSFKKSTAHHGLCTVQDLYGKDVQVPLSALSGPNIFFVIKGPQGLCFWTVADAQLLVKCMVQHPDAPRMQKQFELLRQYLPCCNKLPVDQQKYHGIVELFNEFSIKPSLLSLFDEWGIAVPRSITSQYKDPLKSLAALVDLAQIDQKTWRVIPCVLVVDIKRKILQARATGIAPFPFLYKKQLSRKINYAKAANKSLHGASRPWRFMQIILTLGVIGIAGVVAATVAEKSPKVTVPSPNQNPFDHSAEQKKPVPYVPLKRQGPTRSAFTVGRRRGHQSITSSARNKIAHDCKKTATQDEYPSTAEDIPYFYSSQANKSAYESLLKQGLLTPNTVANVIGIDAVAQIIGFKRTKEIWGEEVANACCADNAMDEDPADGSPGVEPVEEPPSLPLFFLRDNKRLFAIGYTQYALVLVQCSAEEKRHLDEIIKLYKSSKGGAEKICNSTVIADERVVTLFRKYAPKLFA